MRVGLCGLVIGVMCGVASAGPAPRQTVGTASFAVPKGWTVREGAGDAADHIAITKADNKQYCILVTFMPAPATDLETAFAAEWANGLSAAGAAPKSTSRKVGSRVVREAGLQTTIEGTNLYAAAHVILLEQQSVAVISYSTNAKALTWCRPDLDKLLLDLQVTAVAAAPATAATAPAAAPAPAPAAPTGGTSIHLADLAGKWANNGAATTSYIDSYGNYSGTSTTFFGEWYTIKADGSYTYSFQGRASNHTVRETGAGKFSFSGDLLIITGTRADTKYSKKYHLLGYQAGSDGTGVLTLLDESYPTTSGNIALYKEVWIKNPTAKK